jgi:hypothetical protein
MDAKTIVELLEPLIGKRGSVNVTLKDALLGGMSTRPEHPIVRVAVRQDGWIEVVTDDGWAVFHPAQVISVSWGAKDGERAGAYL